MGGQSFKMLCDLLLSSTYMYSFSHRSKLTSYERDSVDLAVQEFERKGDVLADKVLQW